MKGATMDCYYTAQSQGYGGTYDDFVQENYEAYMGRFHKDNPDALPTREQFNNMVYIANDAKGF